VAKRLRPDDAEVDARLPKMPNPVRDEAPVVVLRVAGVRRREDDDPQFRG
jgi:hypothetical protein